VLVNQGKTAPQACKEAGIVEQMPLGTQTSTWHFIE